MSAAPSRFVVKTGAEGVHVAGIRATGLGIAVKIDDGARRAAELVMAVVLRLLGMLDQQDASQWERPVVLNRRGEPVGTACAAASWLADAETKTSFLRADIKDELMPRRI